MTITRQRPLVTQRHRHLKWEAFDTIEAALMVVCGICVFVFTITVACDVVTRVLGTPWLWLRQVTAGFFVWGVFAGMAVAVRRHDHFCLTEITRRMRGKTRLIFETVNRSVVLIVALLLVWFGWKNALLDLGSYRPPSLIPLAVFTAGIPAAGVLIALFSVEQLVNGWRNGFESSDDSDEPSAYTEE